MQQLTAKALQTYLETVSNQPLLLDVREPWEFQICHIRGSQLVPMRQIPDHLPKLNPEQTIIVICHHGIRSRQVAQFLEVNGFKNVINLMGGVAAWAEMVDPTMPTY